MPSVPYGATLECGCNFNVIRVRKQHKVENYLFIKALCNQNATTPCHDNLHNDSISTYHDVPDKPLRYITLFKRFKFLRPLKLPYVVVRDLVPPPVVMTAITGTYITPKHKTFFLKFTFVELWYFSEKKRNEGEGGKKISEKEQGR